MVVIERYEKTAADPEAAYRAGTLIRVKWPHVDGASAWYTAMITAVSERIAPVRERSTPSHYRYTLMFADESRSQSSRLLHLQHETLFKPRAQLGRPRSFVHCDNGKRYELPVGVYYSAKQPRLRVAMIATPRNFNLSLGQYRSGRLAVEAANRKRLGVILDHLHRQHEGRED
ncbi:unnamed protein product [Amoebophrya sp. A120]|nr:unnamed protein product [Amoebophrya sp. A120]|eukprot:GSA120T00025341001.1